MPQYELWDDGDGGLTFLPEGDGAESPHSARRLIDEKARLVWTVEAENWDKAMAAYYEHMGWEPYQPMHDE